MTLLEPKYVGQIGKNSRVIVPAPFRYTQVATLDSHLNAVTHTTNDTVNCQGAKEMWIVFLGAIQTAAQTFYVRWSIDGSGFLKMSNEAGAQIGFSTLPTGAGQAVIIGNSGVTVIGHNGIPIACSEIKIGVTARARFVNPFVLAVVVR